MSRTRIAVLGAGPAGVGAAWRLAERGSVDVTVLEQRNDVGGNAGSFDLGGLSVDYGSHRLHPSCEPKILDDLRALLAGDLLDRPRHGRIRLRGRWIHFPLKPQDLALHLPWTFGAGVARDALRKVAKRQNRNGHGEETFTSVLENGLGQTICRDFYFPYARKIWGLPPEELSSTQAHRRVSAGSLSKMAGKVLGFMSSSQTPRRGRFFYPQDGYGQISRAMARAATEAGADIQLGCTVRSVSLGRPHRIEVESDGQLRTLAADYVWSTIPISILARITRPEAPPEVLSASRQIESRAMVLIYLMLDQSQWTEFDAHYFPEADIKLTRLSEPKNYSGRKDPINRTVLCGELPCTVDDEIWRASDEELTALVRHSLERCGLSIEAPISRVVTKRLAHAYPIYRQGYEQYFNLLDGWANSLDRVLTFGRQGLFAHDNTHHALAMAYGAVDCLSESGEFNDDGGARTEPSLPGTWSKTKDS